MQALIASAGGLGNLLPGCIPVPVQPGDCIVHSRNIIHGSLPNLSESTRCTLYFGFFAKPSVAPYYNAATIRQQARLIPLAVALRAKESAPWSKEPPFVYAPIPDFSDGWTMEEIEDAIEECRRHPKLQI